MGRTLLHKIWDSHRVRELSDGRTQLFVGLHLIHEVTSPQAFGMLRDLGLPVRCPERTFATVDHIIPTKKRLRPFRDPMAEEMTAVLEAACREHGIRLFDAASGRQGIVHVVGPELGLTQPGLTVACGDSHTSTHGALGAVAFGVGTTQVRDILATQTVAMAPMKVRRIAVDGKLGAGVYAKDLILYIIGQLGVNAGAGFAYEYAGSTVSALSMEERLTLCNMSIEGAARAGYVNPDETTFEYLRGKPFAPQDGAFDQAVSHWRSTASDPDASYDDVVQLAASDVAPMVTWGINPGQVIAVSGHIPRAKDLPAAERTSLSEALAYMGLSEGQTVRGTKVDVAFIGSCTNGRISDLREVARHVRGRRVKSSVRALIVPGSLEVQRQAEGEGLHEIFQEAGFEWRDPGCSMCNAMNPDRLQGRELCASSSNRNFKGRQGSPTGRTLLMSPVMVAAAALEGAIVDARALFASPDPEL
jgi:3-isopropylmalate/(R)-2-methylmalate dehydratase large subunit